MRETLKKIALIAGVLGTTFVFGFLLYFFFFRPLPAPEPQIPTQPGGQLPTPGTGGPTVVQPGGTGVPGQLPSGQATATPNLPSFPGEATVSAPTTVSERPASFVAAAPGGAAFYDAGSGQFYRVQNDGTLSLLSSKTFFGIESVTWDTQARQAILEFPDGANVLYNFATDTQVTLPQHWEDFAFAGSEKIVGKALGQDKENRWLFTANADGSATQAVQALGANADKVDVAPSPNSQVLAFSRTGEGRDGNSQEIYLLGQNQENFRSLVVPGFGFEPKWAPGGNTLLYSVYNQSSGYRPRLYVASGSGPDELAQQRTDLQINTFADKCTFQNASVLFCAVPVTMEAGAGLQPDIAAGVPDAVYKIDLTTGQQQLVMPSNGNAVTSLIPSPDGSTLWYTDSSTGQLKKVTLQ